MDYKLAKEIYSPWFVDAMSMQTLSEMLQAARAGSISDVKSNAMGYIGIQQAKPVYLDNPWSMEDLKKDEQYIAMYSIDGPITKHGGASHNGMTDLAARMGEVENTENIKGHILMIESGGGSANAVAEMSDAIQAAQKPVVAFIDGMAASAAYYIAVYADKIYAKREADYVGSIGTMIKLSGFENKSTDDMGRRHVRIYATGATEKNEEFEQAINELNFEPMRENILNPLNQQFVADVKANRPDVQDEQLTGRIYKAGQAVGTLIDEIAPLQSAVDYINNESQTKLSSMNLEQLRQEHPDVYQQVYEQGVTAERDRVSAIMTYVDVDAESVKAKIESGEQPTQKFYAEMNRKALATSMETDAKNEAEDEIQKPEEQKVETGESQEVKQAEMEARKAAGLDVEPEKTK